MLKAFAWLLLHVFAFIIICAKTRTDNVGLVALYVLLSYGVTVALYIWITTPRWRPVSLDYVLPQFRMFQNVGEFKGVLKSGEKHVY